MAREKVIEQFGEGLLQQTRRRPFGLMRRGKMKKRMTVKERIAHRATTKSEAREKENWKRKGREKKTMGPGESDDDGTCGRPCSRHLTPEIHNQSTATAWTAVASRSSLVVNDNNCAFQLIYDILYYPSRVRHYSLSNALYTLLSFIRRRPSWWDTNIPTKSATTCAIHRSNPIETATFMMAAHKSINRADSGIGTSSNNAEMNLVGASKTETLNNERATRDSISNPGYTFLSNLHINNTVSHVPFVHIGLR